MHAWQDLDNRKNLMVATDLGVQILVQDTVYGLGKQVNVADATFSVIIGTTEVTVLTAAVGKVWRLLYPPIADLHWRAHSRRWGLYTVKKIVPGGFAFDMPIAALTTETSCQGHSSVHE